MGPCRLSDIESKFSCVLRLIYIQRNVLVNDVNITTNKITADKERGIFEDWKLSGVCSE